MMLTLAKARQNSKVLSLRKKLFTIAVSFATACRIGFTNEHPVLRAASRNGHEETKITSTDYV